MRKNNLLLKISKKLIKYSYCTCNFYIGCDNSCDYCCLNKISRGLFKKRARLLFKDKNEALDIFKKSVNKDLKNLQKYGVFFSFTTDPMLENTKELTYLACEYCIKKNIPFKILTKCTDWGSDSFIMNYPDDKKYLAHIGFSLTGRDDLEKNVSKNKERVKLLKKLYKLGFKTWISAEPIIDIDSTINILNGLEDYCYMIRFEILTPYKNSSVTKLDKNDLLRLYKWISNNTKDTFIYLSDKFLRILNFQRENLEEKFVKTGDLIIELKNEKS